MQPMLINVGNPELELQDDHKKALDAIFELLKAIEQQDVRRAREIIGAIDLVSGPHWRWEEEVLYPALRQFSDELVDGLMKEHDEFIYAVEELTSRFRKRGAGLLQRGVGAVVGVLTSRFQKEALAAEDWERAHKLTQPLIYHLATCDGLIIWMELLGEEEQQTIKQAIFVARREAIPVLEWAQKLRQR